jgi:hypothetical protein
VAFLYVFLGLAALAGSPSAVAGWGRWGNLPWVTLTAAALEVGAGLLILSPRAGGYALAVLSALMTGATVVHLRHDEPVSAALACLLLVLTVGLGLVRGLHGRERMRLHAALDAFAEGELAKERRRVARRPAAGRGSALSRGR